MSQGNLLMLQTIDGWSTPSLQILASSRALYKKQLKGVHWTSLCVEAWIYEGDWSTLKYLTPLRRLTTWSFRNAEKMTRKVLSAPKTRQIRGENLEEVHKENERRIAISAERLRVKASRKLFSSRGASHTAPKKNEASFQQNACDAPKGGEHEAQECRVRQEEARSRGDEASCRTGTHARNWGSIQRGDWRLDWPVRLILVKFLEI